MKKIFAATLLCSLPLTASMAADNPNQARIDQSKAVVQEFFGQLKGELGKAMKEGGPIQAITVCNKVAPHIAEQLSAKYNMHVARTSLKTRNPNNAPDAWETKVLKQFEERHAKGESADKMAFAEVIEEGGKKEFRFMKAIGMPPLEKMPCLKCHGEHIDAKVAAKLDELYPDDKARGYKVGDIRGAFTIRQPM